MNARFLTKGPRGELENSGVRLILLRYFSNPIDALISAVCIICLVYVSAILFRWAVLDSSWFASSSAECREAGTGACWSVIRERGRLIFFGLYPYEEQWRAFLACVILLSAAIITCLGVLRTFLRIAILWAVSFVIFTTLMSGGVFGLTPVPKANWGGLALTFYIFAVMMILGMPLAVVMALIRHNGTKWTRVPIGAIIDIVRSIPLTAVLLSMALVVPLFAPSWLSGDKLSRIVVGFSIFFACYQAEIFRGALQTINLGQGEAARTLGMREWQLQITVILPQMFRISLPPTVNQVVAAFKDTSYVAIVGFFDLTASASVAKGTGEWASAFVEVYLFVVFLYLVFLYPLSRYGAYLERCADVAYQR